MNPPKIFQKEQKVGGQPVEKLSFNLIEKEHNISKEELLKVTDKVLSESIPISILKSPKLSSLEAIVKFLRENRNLSYHTIGLRLNRNPKTLAVTYAVAHRKMPEGFPKNVNDDSNRIPFIVFSNRLSVLEAVCTCLKSLGNSYAEIARMIGKDQRTVWTVCKRAEKKLGEGYKRKYGR